MSGLLCSVFKRHSTKSKYNKSSVWSDTPYASLYKDVRRHSTSIQHQDAIQREIYHEAAKHDGGIAQALELEVCHEKKAVKGAMQCLYWLVRSEIPHTKNYGSLVDAVRLMGCEYFKHLHKGENAKYKSRRIIQECLELLARQIKDKQLQELKSSMFYSLKMWLYYVKWSYMLVMWGF